MLVPIKSSQRNFIFRKSIKKDAVARSSVALRGTHPMTKAKMVAVLKKIKSASGVAAREATINITLEARATPLRTAVA